jgi:hypothetical protein
MIRVRRTTTRSAVPCLLLVGMSLLSTSALAAGAEFRSHPPTRPLPEPSDRPLADGPHFFVATNGDDAHDGSERQPWRTLAHALERLRPGDTLCLRGGTYHQRATATLVGTAERPITIRAPPGELVILDGGLPEFLDDPAHAWEPCPDGVAGEFRSTRMYADLEPSEGDHNVALLGNFADSWLPLHGYWHRPDLQSDNPYWTLSGEKTLPNSHVYCGPGLWYDADTDRIHCRLAHTRLPGLHEDNYRGETDPRRLPLVVAAWSGGSVLTLQDSRFVRLQDLVLRGARQPTLSLEGGANLEVDGLVVHGGQSCLKVADVEGFRMSHTACRGLAAPWTFRGSLKYRSIESKLFSTTGWSSTGRPMRSYEIAYCEFTDSVDGVFVGNVDELEFRFNLLDNVSDDGLFVTAATDYEGATPGGGQRFYGNRFARCLTTFAFGVGHGRQRTVADPGEETGRWGTRQVGGGLVIARNVFDFRRPVPYQWPTGPDAPQEITSRGRFAGDHGSPAWEPMTIAHNTLLTGDPPRYEYGTDGFSRAVVGTRRRLYDNLICQINGLPGAWLPDGEADWFADGNLLWSASDGPTTQTLPEPRRARDLAPAPPSWTAHDLFADPRFVAFDADWREPVDLRLRADSPAVDAGVPLPPTDRFDDPLRDRDEGRPDIGAIPRGVEPWRIGRHGRLDVCGNAVPADAPPVEISWVLPRVEVAAPPAESVGRAAVVTGYPAFEAPLVTFALRKRGIPVDLVERAWLDPREYEKYGVVIVDGSFARAKVTPTRYADDELPIVRRFLERGGTLWLFRERHDLFGSEAGRRMLAEFAGTAKSDDSKAYSLLAPEHPWVAHLSRPGSDLSWLERGASPLNVQRGEVLLGTPSGRALLARVPVGKGQIVYVGWNIAASLPGGREPATLADERRYEEQMRIVANIAASLRSGE